jgi:hypothetical protein
VTADTEDSLQNLAKADALFYTTRFFGPAVLENSEGVVAMFGVSGKAGLLAPK